VNTKNVVLDTDRRCGCWGCERAIGADEYKLVLGTMDGNINILEVYCEQCAPGAIEDWNESES
jgi:hypothetical protein